MIANRNSDFLSLARPTWQISVLAIFCFILGILALRLDAIQNISSAYLGGIEGDAGLYVWLSKHAARSFFELPWFSTLAFYPYGGALAWSDNYILPGLLFGGLHSLGVSEIASYNLIYLAAILLNAYCTFRLVYSLTGDVFSAVACGILMITFLPLSAHLGHPQMQHLYFIPLGILSLLRFIQEPSFNRAFFLSLLVFLSFITAVYYSLFLVLLIGVFLASFFTLHPHTLSWRIPLLLLGGAVVPCIFLTPFVLPYLEIKDIFGSRGLFESYYFSATAHSFISAPSTSAWYSFLSPYSHSEARFFGGLSIIIFSIFGFRRIFDTPKLKYPRLLLGVLTISLLAFASVSTGNQFIKYILALFSWGSIGLFFFMLKRLGDEERLYGSSIVTNRNIIGLLTLCAMVFFIVSLGPLGNPEKGHTTLGVYAFFYYVIPGFDALRAVGRAGLVGIYLCALISFLVFSRLRGAEKISPALFITLLIAPTVENLVSVYQLDYPAKKPQVLAQINHKQGIVAGLPYATNLDSNGNIQNWSSFARTQVYFMNWFEDINASSINGYSGQISKVMRDAPRRLAGFPDDRSIRELSTLAGLNQILYVSSFDPDFDRALFEAKLEMYKESLSLKERDSEGNYLIDFHPKVSLDNDYILKTSRSLSSIKLTLTPRGACKEKETIIKVFDSEASSIEPLSTSRITKESSDMTIALSALDLSYRPLRLRFETAGCPQNLIATSLISP